jgi:hypothetical protein
LSSVSSMASDIISSCIEIVMILISRKKNYNFKGILIIFVQRDLDNKGC